MHVYGTLLLAPMHAQAVIRLKTFARISMVLWTLQWRQQSRGSGTAYMQYRVRYCLP